MPRPLISWKPACGKPGLELPIMSEVSWKLNAPYGVPSLRCVAIADYSCRIPRRHALGRRVGGELTDAEDDELGWLDDGDADETDQPPVVQIVLCHGRAVAAHEERLLWLGAHQSIVLPLAVKEVPDGLANVGPGHLVVLLEDHPLGALFNGVLDVIEVAPRAQILPARVRADRARAPESDSAAGEEAEAIDADRVEHVLLR